MKEMVCLNSKATRSGTLAVPSSSRSAPRKFSRRDESYIHSYLFLVCPSLRNKVDNPILKLHDHAMFQIFHTLQSSSKLVSLPRPKQHCQKYDISRRLCKETLRYNNICSHSPSTPPPSTLPQL